MFTKPIHRKLLWSLIGCALLATAVFVLCYNPEPEYQHRRLSEWVLEQGHVVSQSRPSTVAIQQIGTNAVPFLLKWIQYKPSPTRNRLYRLLYRMPRKVQPRLLRFFADRGPQLRENAWTALLILGPKAKSAIPTLKQLVRSGETFWPIIILAGAGDEGAAALCEISTNKTDTLVARVIALECIIGWPERWSSNAQIHSVLMSSVSDPNDQIRTRAVKALQKLSPSTNTPSIHTNALSATGLKRN